VIRAGALLVGALLSGAGAVWAWLSARSVVDVAPILDGEPATTSVVYYPPLVLLALLLLTVAGVLAVLGVASRRRRFP
jgi:hypothetical protein